MNIRFIHGILNSTTRIYLTIGKVFLGYHRFVFSLWDATQSTASSIIYIWIVSCVVSKNDCLTWKSDIILRIAVSTILAVARFLALAFLLLRDEAGQSNCDRNQLILKSSISKPNEQLTMCSVSHMQSWEDWYSRLKAAVFSNSSRHPSSAFFKKKTFVHTYCD